jgi:hypothetical protein
MGAHGGRSLLHDSPLLEIISNATATPDQRATPLPLKMDTPMAHRNGRAGVRGWRGGPTVIRMMCRPWRGSCCFQVGRRRDTTSYHIVQVRMTAVYLFEKNSLTFPAGSPYDIEIFVSGYVVKDKATDVLSRSQRTLLKLAKSWLPSLFP